MSGDVLRVGTRRSELARTQTGHVCRMLESIGFATEEVLVTSAGDVDRTRPLHLIGSDPGFFTRALEDALADGRIDVAVHSLKDLPLAGPEALPIVAIPAREDPRDTLLVRRGHEDDARRLIPGARFGSSSPRRQTQILAAQPDAIPVDIRGNIGTRIALLDDGTLDALLVARAALNRLGIKAGDGVVATDLPLDGFPTSAGQGALAIQMRRDDPRVKQVAALDDPEARAATDAERGLLGLLGGGCSMPLGATAWREGGTWRLRATYAAESWTAPAYAGLRVADVRAARPELLAHLAHVAVGEEPVADAPAPGVDLTGRRIVVALTDPTADAYVDVARAHGARAEAWVLSGTAPIPGEVPGAVRDAWHAGGTWVALASSRAVDAVARLEAECGVGPGVKVAAIGRGTALALRRADLPVHLVAPEATGANLAATLAPIAGAGTAVIMPRAKDATPDLETGLAAAGLTPIPWTVYETAVTDPAPAMPFQPAETLLVGAPSIARRIAELGHGPAIARQWVAMGPSTAKVLREVGLPVHAILPRPSPGAFLEVLPP